MNKNFTKLTIIVLLLVIGTLHTVSAQVYQKFGKDAFNIDTSAALEVNSDTKGFLPPRMTTTQRDAINKNAANASRPANGLVIYNTDTNRLEVNLGTTGENPDWKELMVSSNIVIQRQDTPGTIGYGTDTVLCDTSKGTFTLNLPASRKGKVFTIGKIDGSDLSLKFSSALKLSGDVTVTELNYAKVFRIQGDGTDWYVLE